ncbi:MAG: Holliday junction branch migration protein RuvA [Eubacteriales bacterium]|nr:Holliday junction branch migration protein RuvA [Sarcina sp.]MBR2729114.1 Holliday junction branch migration protein RuvA [Lachnospiraceae bacterium]MDO4416760.1 Holliday junction branch migration protein RuvA [Eubacteriales bacterium]
MIAFLSGLIESFSADTAVIDVGGVGYEVNISAEVSSGLSAIGTGNAVKMYTYTYLREGQIALYGFLSRDDLSLFRQLITVSGIGPKGGLSLLSVLSADDLRFAIVTGDAKMIARAPGVGKKTAERLILDLRDKISSVYAAEGEDDGLLASGRIAGSPAAESESVESSPAGDAVEALVALGYLRAEAARAVKKCAQKEDTEAILREALRYL